MELGYKLSSEEFGPRDLVRQARQAEEAGFTFALISDHFHPWVDKQGHSPFVWGVLGGVAQGTDRLRVGTGVTCPTMRIHPVIVAQAAATAAALMPGRFFLGVGTGENLNEHIVGHRWPPIGVRQEMLEEAVAVIRQLWQGGYQDHHGRFYTVERARIYTRPEVRRPIYVAPSGTKAPGLRERRGGGRPGAVRCVGGGRAGSRAPRRRDWPARRGGLHTHLRTPDRPRPGGLSALLRPGGHPASG